MNKRNITIDTQFFDDNENTARLVAASGDTAGGQSAHVQEQSQESSTSYNQSNSLSFTALNQNVGVRGLSPNSVPNQHSNYISQNMTGAVTSIRGTGNEESSFQSQQRRELNQMHMQTTNATNSIKPDNQHSFNQGSNHNQHYQHQQQREYFQQYSSSSNQQHIEQHQQQQYIQGSGYSSQPQLVMDQNKLHAANLFENSLSRLMSVLFISCWEELKMHGLGDEQDSGLRDGGRMGGNDWGAAKKQAQSPLARGSGQGISQSPQHQEYQQRKREILQRQARGLTLDSLQKYQQYGRIPPERDGNTSSSKSPRHNKIQQPGGSIINKINEANSSSSNSYHHQHHKVNNKFNNQFVDGGGVNYSIQQQHHRQNSNISNSNNIRQNSHHIAFGGGANAHSRQLSNFRSVSQHHQPIVGGSIGNNIGNNFNSRRVVFQTQHNHQFNSPHSHTHYKNDLLHNISHLLKGGQENTNSFSVFNHTSRLRNHHSRHANLSYDNIHHTPNHINCHLNHNSHCQLEYMQEDQEIERARLLEDIVQKLNHKTRYIGGNNVIIEDNGNTNKEDLQMIRKLARLQKIVLDIKREGQREHPRSRQPTPQPQPQPQHSTSAQTFIYQKRRYEEELYRKLADELRDIKSQIGMLKHTTTINNRQPIIQQQPPPLPPQPQPNYYQNIDPIIQDQRRLIDNYQREYEKLISTKNTSFSSQISAPPPIVVPPPPAQPQKKGGFLGGIMAAVEKKNQENKKVEQSEGWRQSNKKKGGRTMIEEEEQIQTKYAVKAEDQTRERHQRLKRFQSADVYRYTRNQVLQNIGRKEQIQEEARLYQETQNRLRIDKERRQEEFRLMTEKVKARRQHQIQQEQINANRPMHYKMENEWQQFQRQRIQGRGGKNEGACCGWFPC